MKSTDWKKYITANGDFEFPKYLYKTITDLMKTSLDLGTMICTDPHKLRAYKEQVKSFHNQKWLDIAAALEFFDIIEPCSCNDSDFCSICGGSRYLLSEAMTADEIQQVSIVIGNTNLDKDVVVQKLWNINEGGADNGKAKE